MTIRVKICGITSVADACLCHESGADLLGVVLTDSPRRVDAATAAAIRAAVPTARLVGVVRAGDGDPAALARLVLRARVDVVQLHDGADPALWAAVAAACGLSVMPAVTAERAAAAAAALDAMPFLPCEGLLLDLPKNGASNDPAARARLWQAARAALGAGTPVFLAGALEVTQLRAVRNTVGSCHLDVCRGTERAPGVKDPDLVRGFVAAARDLKGKP